jgi:hypothetical protein
MSSSATSICSGLGDDPPIAKRVVDHRPRHLGPASGERLVQPDDVDRHSDVTERAAEPNRFPIRSSTELSITSKSGSLPASASPRAPDPNRMTRAGDCAASASARPSRSMIDASGMT